MIVLTTNHKVNDTVYVVSDCVRRGVIQQVNFAQNNDSADLFNLSYDILHDGFTFSTNVVSAVDFAVPGPGSPLALGSPVGLSGSPLGSPSAGISVIVEEENNGGGIFTNKSAALTEFGDTLA